MARRPMRTSSPSTVAGACIAWSVSDRISSDDIGWYQCTIEHEGETYSSIGYFLNVKSATFENTPSSEEDKGGFNMTYNSNDLNLVTRSDMA